MSELDDYFDRELDEHSAVLEAVKSGCKDAYAHMLAGWVAAIKDGNKIVFFGNGGSAADSQHLAAEFVVRFKKERHALASIALTTDTSILTAHTNDYEFDTVFARQVQALVKPEDVVIGLTTSGTSPNINLGLEAANEIGAYTVALTGRDGGQVKDIAKLPIIINNDITARIQEAHMFIGHWLCEAIDELVTQPN